MWLLENMKSLEKIVFKNKISRKWKIYIFLYIKLIVHYAYRGESEGMRSKRQVRRTRPKVIANRRAQEWEPEAVGREFLPCEKVIKRGNDGPKP